MFPHCSFGCAVLVGALSIRDRMPQIEIAVGAHSTVLVFRNLEPLNAADEALMRAFADRHAVEIFLQPKGPDSVVRLHPENGAPLSYTLPEYGSNFLFADRVCFQVNHAINRVLVRRRWACSPLQPGERIADMFCGLGNFTLPIALTLAPMLWVSKAARRWCGAQRRMPRQTASRRGRTSPLPTLFEATEESIATPATSTRC